VASKLHRRTLTGLGHTRKGTTKLICPVLTMLYHHPCACISVRHAVPLSEYHRHIIRPRGFGAFEIDPVFHSHRHLCRRHPRFSLTCNIFYRESIRRSSRGRHGWTTRVGDRCLDYACTPPPAPAAAAKTREGPFLHVNLTFIRLSPHSTL
jgi:hypothetical protein